LSGTAGTANDQRLGPARLIALFRTHKLLFGVLVAGIVFRVALVLTWHVPGGDGMQYHALSQELLLRGRFAFRPPPAPISYTRLPGYPLLLAYGIVRSAPLAIGAHLVRATLANVLFDLMTALLILGIARERRLGERAGIAGVALALGCPIMFLLSCYGLTETFATLLATLEIYLALRAMRTRLWLHAALIGLVAGTAQLVRLDAVAIAPAVVVALVCAAAPLRQRLGAIALSFIIAAAAFSPWPIRNMIEFGHPYFGAWQWRTGDGRPLPAGPLAWARTWAASEPGDSYFDLAFSNEMQLDPARPGIVKPSMYDDSAERARLVALFQRYNREHLTEGVGAAFAAIAKERTARNPLRTYVTLPLRRLAQLWAPVPEYELPMRVPWLGLPSLRPVFGWWDRALFVLSIGGAVLLFRRGRGSEERRTFLILAVAIVGRTLAVTVAVPLGLTERLLVQSFPLLIVLGAVGVNGFFARRAKRAESVPGHSSASPLEVIRP
jgi:4-amino-4-deoxy-L-arabinose transferase-like glycosyltransferase